jgi:hypothetical protein
VRATRWAPVRWVITVLISAVVFTAAWLAAENQDLDTQSAIGFAAVVATLILTPLGWWAGRAGYAQRLDEQLAPADSSELSVRTQVIVGDVPGEAVAWQGRSHLLDRLTTVTSGSRPTVVCAVTGQRGIGKTQLAAAYARHRLAEAGRWWSGSWRRPRLAC